MYASEAVVLRLQAPYLRAGVVSFEKFEEPPQSSRALAAPTGGHAELGVALTHDRTSDRLRDGAAVAAGELPRGCSGLVIEDECSSV